MIMQSLDCCVQWFCYSSAAAHQKLEDSFAKYAVHVLQIFSMMEVHPFITKRV